jgi:hypothetical protein
VERRVRVGGHRPLRFDLGQAAAQSGGDQLPGTAPEHQSARRLGGVSGAEQGGDGVCRLSSMSSTGIGARSAGPPRQAALTGTRGRRVVEGSCAPMPGSTSVRTPNGSISGASASKKPSIPRLVAAQADQLRAATETCAPHSTCSSGAVADTSANPPTSTWPAASTGCRSPASRNSPLVGSCSGRHPSSRCLYLLATPTADAEWRIATFGYWTRRPCAGRPLPGQRPVAPPRLRRRGAPTTGLTGADHL